MLNGVCHHQQIHFKDKGSSVFNFIYFGSINLRNVLPMTCVGMTLLTSNYLWLKVEYIEFGSSPSSWGFLTFDGKLTPVWASWQEQLCWCDLFSRWDRSTDWTQQIKASPIHTSSSSSPTTSYHIFFSSHSEVLPVGCVFLLHSLPCTLDMLPH